MPASKTVTSKTPAQCVFDRFDLKFGMKKDEIARVLEFEEETGLLRKGSLEKAGAEMVELFFDHLDRLWQVKALYPVESTGDAQAMLEKMSTDYRFQTPSARIAFDLSEEEAGVSRLSIRYTEANLKRIYLHHLMAVGAAKLAAAEEMEKAIKEKEEEEYIPSGPMMF